MLVNDGPGVSVSQDDTLIGMYYPGNLVRRP